MVNPLEQDPEASRQAEIDRLCAAYEVDADGYISFNRAAEEELGVLGQYAAAYVDGFKGTPKLAEGLVDGDPNNWYTLRVTPNNFLTFSERLTDYKQRKIEETLGRISNK